MCVQPISSHSEVCTDPQLETSENEETKIVAVGEPKGAPYFFYRNFSDISDPDPSKPITSPGRIPNFPAKMMAILSRPDLADVICWMPHGRSWKVLKPREFEVKVIPTYFEHAKFSSFIRQANGWGFRRIVSKGPDRNSYYHELFLRGRPHLIKMMKRPTTTGRPQADPNTEPDFYRIAQEYPLPEPNPDEDHSHQERAKGASQNQSGRNEGNKVSESYPPQPVSPPHERGVYKVNTHQANTRYDSRPVYYHTHPHASHQAHSAATMMAPPATPFVARALTPIESHESILPVNTHSMPYTARAVSPVSSSSYEMSHPYYHQQHGVEPLPAHSSSAVNEWAATCFEPQEMPHDFEDPFAGGLSPIDFW